MGIREDILRFQQRRNERVKNSVDKFGKKRYNSDSQVRMDFEVGNFSAEESGSKKGHGGMSTRLPYGLCKAAGIDTTGMSPGEAWAALEGGTGVSAKKAYEELGKTGSAKGIAKEAKAGKKEKESEKAAFEPEGDLAGTESLAQGRKRSSEARDRFKAAIDMASDLESIQRILDAVPTGGKVKYTHITKDGKITPHRSTATKNEDGTFTTDSGKSATAEMLSWWVSRDKKEGKSVSLEADDFTLPLPGSKPTAKPTSEPAPTPSAASTPASESTAESETKKSEPEKPEATSSTEKPYKNAVHYETDGNGRLKAAVLDTIKTLRNFSKRHAVWRNKGERGSNWNDEQISKCEDGLKRLFKNNEYCMNFDASILDSIIEKGFLSQHVTKTTHGSDDLVGRRLASHNLFGTETKESVSKAKKGGTWSGEKASKPADYEKYGFLSNPFSETHVGIAGGYGGVTAVFKKENLEGRVTYTATDSLGPGEKGAIAGYAGDNPTVHGLAVDYWGLSSDSKIEEITKELEKEKPSVKALGKPYFELQYHGELTIDDVKAIVFRNKYEWSFVSEKTKEFLKSKGIDLIKAF